MDKKFLIGLVVVSALTLFGGVFLLSYQSPAQTKNAIIFSESDKEKPIAKIESNFYDLGKIKVSDQKQKEFTIKNTGLKPLQLFGFSTSCGCTTGKIFYNGREGPEFSMHAKSDEIIEVAPNTSAVLRLTYSPYRMPSYGQVEREVYISTNDPQNPKLTFSVKAFVE